MTNPVLTIGLLGHSLTSDNFGIGALTQSHLAILRKQATEIGVELRFLVVSSKGSRAPYIDGRDIELVVLRARQLVYPQNGLAAVLRRCDLVIDITAGDSFADIYGNKRFLLSAVPKLVAIASRRPLILAPQTIGPFRQAWTRLFARAVMSRSRSVVTRDRQSSELVRALGLEGRLVESTDVAFRLDYETTAMPETGLFRVGINVSGLLFNGGYTGANMFGLSIDYRELMHQIVRQFVDRGDCEVHLIGHVMSKIMPVEDDVSACRKLAEAFPGTILAPDFSTPSDAKGYIAAMDFFLGSRMHACIAAFSAGVPTLPLAYSRKFIGVFGTLGYETVADCRAETADSIIDMTADAFARRDALAAETVKCLETADERIAVYEETLRSALLDVARSGRSR